MSSAKIFRLLSRFLLMFVGVISATAQTSQMPGVFLLDAKVLRENRRKIIDPKANDSYKAAMANLEKDAQQALKTDIASVITKEANPPSGDRHDYMSQAPYFWRNPDTKDGLPYIRRDGERNPEIKKYPDHDLLDKMIEAVSTLSEAYFFTGKEEYAAKATEILRLWFLDAKTKMNPNLDYAQAIPGLNTGRGIGIIETRNLPRVVDAVGLLANSKAWTKTDQSGLEKWFGDYLNWLMTSKNGRDEAAAKNNHGTFYDVQIADYALFVGKKELTKTILETAKTKRIALQVDTNGEQPLELERTKSWDYSVMNLDGLMQLAILGESVGVDLWNFKTAKSGGIRQASEFLYQFKDNEKNWKHEQIELLKIEKIYPLMRRAADVYTDKNYRKILSFIPSTSPESVANLLGW